MTRNHDEEPQSIALAASPSTTSAHPPGLRSWSRKAIWAASLPIPSWARTRPGGRRNQCGFCDVCRGRGKADSSLPAVPQDDARGARPLPYKARRDSPGRPSPLDRPSVAPSPRRGTGERGKEAFILTDPVAADESVPRLKAWPDEAPRATPVLRFMIGSSPLEDERNRGTGARIGACSPPTPGTPATHPPYRLSAEFRLGKRDSPRR